MIVVGQRTVLSGATARVLAPLAAHNSARGRPEVRGIRSRGSKLLFAALAHDARTSSVKGT